MQLKLKVLDFQHNNTKLNSKLCINLNQNKRDFENIVQQSSQTSCNKYSSFQHSQSTLIDIKEQLLINIQNPQEKNILYISFYCINEKPQNSQYLGFCQINFQQIYSSLISDTDHKLKFYSQFYGLKGKRERIIFQIHFIEVKQEKQDDKNFSISICQNFNQKQLTRTNSKKGQNSFSDQDQKSKPMQQMEKTILKQESKLKKKWLLSPNEIIREQVYMENLNDSFSSRDQMKFDKFYMKSEQKYDNISTSESGKLVDSRKKKASFFNQKFKLIKYLHQLQLNNLMMMQLQRRVNDNSD